MFAFQPKLQFKLTLIFQVLIFIKDKKNVLTEPTNKNHNLKTIHIFQIKTHTKMYSALIDQDALSFKPSVTSMPFYYCMLLNCGLSKKQVFFKTFKKTL